MVQLNKSIHAAILTLAVLLSILLLGQAGTIQVAAAPPGQVIQPPGPATEPIDVVVVLDDSGSMATCWPWPEQGLPFEPPCRFPSTNEPSDPNELRYSAARLLVHLADDADRLSVIRFDSQAEGVGTMGTLQEAGSVERRRILAASLQPPDDYLSRGYTRMDLGLQQAADILEANRGTSAGAPRARNQYVLLLTDGEPTAPASAGGVRARISQEIERLQRDGVLIAPVVLCNPSSGCEGEFLAEQFGPDLREAQTASDLVRVFSEVFSAMKSDRSVVTARDAQGNVAFNTRSAHGVTRIAFVSPRAAITGVARDEMDVATRSLLEDGNIDLNVVEGDLPAGRWTAETGDPSAFAVVQAASYPELVFPPPSALNSPASTRYYPAGKQPLLVARGNGPAAGETLLLEGQIAMSALAGDANIGYYAPSNAPDQVTIQLGDILAGQGAGPLQLQRSFRLEARDDLPQAEAFSPTAADPGILEDGRARFEVGFGPGAPVQGLEAVAYVTDVTEEETRPIYQTEMTCGERTCTDEGFTPQDGRSYRLRYLVTATANEMRFGDWAEAALDVEPAVYLRGLPDEIDLAQQPEDGWPVSVVAGTTEEIGTLEASLDLFRRVEQPASPDQTEESASSDADSEPVDEVSLTFSPDVPEEGEAQARFRVQGLEQLRPGYYSGQIRLQAISPAGRPMNVKIRPAPILPVSLTVERSVARLQDQEANFGEIPFDTSPNFRVDETILMPVRFEPGGPFPLTAQLASSSCSDLSVTSGDVQQQDGGYVLPLRLQSQGPLEPGNCTGQIGITPPNADFDVFPDSLPVRLHVRALEWSISGDLAFGDLGRAGERATETLLVRFDGPTPFTVRMIEFDASGNVDRRLAIDDWRPVGGAGTNVPTEPPTADRQSPVTNLDESAVEMPPVEVSGPPNGDGYYEVPITLVARRAIPLDPIRGSMYSGDLVLGIEGLPGESRMVDVAFRSPSLYQRHIAWWLVPIYSLPWLLCTGPLTLLLMIIALARVRSRSYVEEEEEPVVTLPQPQLETQTESAFIGSAFGGGSRALTTSEGESFSSSVDWGGEWGAYPSEGNGENQTRSPVPRAPATDDDPWSSRW